MGCGSSQSVAVVNTDPMQPNNAIEQKIDKKDPLEVKSQMPSRLAPLPNIARYDSGISSKVDTNSNDSDNISERRNSMSSNSDSFCLEGEYKTVITEKSKKDLVEKIEKDFIERNNLQLSVSGIGCPPLLSDKEKEKQSQEMLKTNGLVLKPILQKPNSAHFEIKAIDSVVKEVRPPPPRLAREKTRVMTAEEIEEKLERANQRKLEQIRLKSSISMKPGESFAESLNRQQSASMRPQSAVSRQQSANLRPKSSTMRQLSANNEEVIQRQKKLREIRDKIRAKDNAKNNETNLTPRTKEIVDEFEVFRPKTPAAFRPEF